MHNYGASMWPFRPRNSSGVAANGALGARTPRMEYWLNMPASLAAHRAVQSRTPSRAEQRMSDKQQRVPSANAGHNGPDLESQRTENRNRVVTPAASSYSHVDWC